jgi:hypothetical protein
VGRPKNSEPMIKAIERQGRALELVKEGKTYEQIAAILGYASKAGAYKAVSTALKNTIQEPADELRSVHRIRLQAMWDAIWWAERICLVIIMLLLLLLIWVAQVLVCGKCGM